MKKPPDHYLHTKTRSEQLAAEIRDMILAGRELRESLAAQIGSQAIALTPQAETAARREGKRLFTADMEAVEEQVSQRRGEVRSGNARVRPRRLGSLV